MPNTKSPEETMQIAKEFAQKLPNNVICLFGEIGSGKTTFTKGLLDELIGDSKQVKSPTYTYIRTYQAEKPIYHLDLYRVSEHDHLLKEELDELFSNKNSIIIIEWAEKIKDQLPPERSDIHFEYIDENSRKIDFS